MVIYKKNWKSFLYIVLLLLVGIFIVNKLHIDGFNSTELKLTSEWSPLPHKVAIIFSGRIKGYHVPSVENNLRNILERYKPIAFCSLNKKNKTEYVKKFCELMDITDDRLNLEVVPNILGFLDNPNNPNINISGDYKRNWGDIEVNKRFENMSSFFYHNKKVMTLVQKYQSIHSIEFDVVLFYRADIDSPELIVINNEIKNNIIYIPDCGDHGGLCNLLFYGNFSTMKTVCNLIDNIEYMTLKKGVQFHAETLLKVHIEQYGILVKRFPYNFSLNGARHEPNLEADAI